MKILNYALLCSSMVLFCNLSAQTTQKPSGQGTTPSNIVRPPLGGRPADNTQGKDSEKEKPFSPERAPQFAFRPIFKQPGILSLRAGGFVGVDHLFNIGANIPVVVEIVKSDSVMMAMTRERIQQVIERLFEAEGISPMIKPSEGPALPFFQVLLMVIPAGEGYSAYCSGRVFERVNLDRVNLPAGVYFQAITWEFQNIIFASKEDSEKQIDSAIGDIVQQFLSRYRYYKNIPASQ